MTPISELAMPANGDHQCTIAGCGQPPCFRIRLERPGEPPCACESSSAGSCAAHLVDAIHQLAQWARAQCPHPAEVTVYVADQPTKSTRSPHCQGFAFTTFHVPE